MMAVRHLHGQGRKKIVQVLEDLDSQPNRRSVGRFSRRPPRTRR